MKKWMVLSTKLVLFVVVLVWILCFLMAGILLHEGYYNYLLSLNIHPGATLSVLVLWYFFTLVVVSILTVVWGFKRIGKWERKDED